MKLVLSPDIGSKCSDAFSLYVGPTDIQGSASAWHSAKDLPNEMAEGFASNFWEKFHCFFAFAGE